MLSKDIVGYRSQLCTSVVFITLAIDCSLSYHSPSTLESKLGQLQSENCTQTVRQASNLILRILEPTVLG